MAAILFSLALASVAFALPTQEPWSIGQEVETTSGKLVGHEAKWPENSGVSEYLGVPFAKPPVGELRWKKPEAFKSSDVFKAEKFGADCPQVTKEIVDSLHNNPKLADVSNDIITFGAAIGASGNEKFDEDCLTLNVWTKPQTGEKKKAVMVWIYGGASTFGSSSPAYYNPARYAAEHDVVAVSMNYRVGILGFPGYPILDVQNQGLWDQRLAIEWVRDNIEKFGGDPKRIVLFGESAGGASVDGYTYAFADDPIVTGIIAESGTAVGLTGDEPVSRPWNTISKVIGCNKGDNMACMRNATWQELLRGSSALGVIGGASGLLAYWPVIDNKIIFKDIHDRQENGKFAKIPMLTGNNDNEAGLVSGFAIAIAKYIQKQKGLPPFVQAVPTFINLLKDGTGGFVDAIRGFLHFIEDGIFDCPANSAAAARTKAGVPAWRYRMMAKFPDSLIEGVGGYHVSEVPIVMGTTERRPGAKAVPEELELIKTTMTAWSTFAKDPVHGLEKLGWPKYDPAGNTLIRLGTNNTGGVEFVSPSLHDKNCKNLKWAP